MRAASDAPKRRCQREEIEQVDIDAVLLDLSGDDLKIVSHYTNGSCCAARIVD